MGGLAALRRGADADLSLTFEAQAAALQPALEVDDSLRARAAAIFEKEQEYVLEAAQPAPSRASRRELYITENGYAFTLISFVNFTDVRGLSGLCPASCITGS
jgi:mediator of replication checkpoint protein 1